MSDTDRNPHGKLEAVREFRDPWVSISCNILFPLVVLLVPTLLVALPQVNPKWKGLDVEGDFLMFSGLLTLAISVENTLIGTYLGNNGKKTPLRPIGTITMAFGLAMLVSYVISVIIFRVIPDEELRGLFISRFAAISMMATISAIAYGAWSLLYIDRAVQEGTSDASTQLD